MPTENRSSNKEMVSVKRELVEQAMQACFEAGFGIPHDALRDVLAQSSPQPHPDPVAWMVGTAFWWTREEAERDAEATGLPVVPVGPMVDTAEVERLESRINTQRESIRSHVQEVDRLRVLEIKYGLKIEERNDLLRKCLEWITSARDGVLYPIARDFEGVVGRNAEGLGQATPALIDAIDDALSASAEPSAPAMQIPEGYCVMPRRLTAENGAKALLLGEFKLEVTRECPECVELEEPAEGCEICDGAGEYGQRYTIPWDKIKFIYSEAVKGLALKQ